MGDGINDAPSLALAHVGIALQAGSQETAASDAASIILLGNRLSQVRFLPFHNLFLSPDSSSEHPCVICLA